MALSDLLVEAPGLHRPGEVQAGAATAAAGSADAVTHAAAVAAATTTVAPDVTSTLVHQQALDDLLKNQPLI